MLTEKRIVIYRLKYFCFILQLTDEVYEERRYDGRMMPQTVPLTPSLVWFCHTLDRGASEWFHKRGHQEKSDLFQ